MNKIKQLCLKLEDANETLKENSDALFHMKDSVTEDETGSNAIMACVKALKNANEELSDVKNELDFYSDIPELLSNAMERFCKIKEDVTDEELYNKLDNVYELYSKIEAKFTFDKDKL